MTTGPDGWWHVIQAYKTFTPVRVRQSLTGGSILDLAAAVANIEKIPSLRQQNVPQPGNRQCALVQGAVVEVGEREVLASGRFIGELLTLFSRSSGLRLAWSS